jgi:hypothetical protein
MATLLELNTIEVNSTADPGGDPSAEPPVPPDPDIVAARALRAKVRTAVIKRAGVIMQTALPTDGTRGPALELLAWAQRTVNSPEGSTATVFRLTLVNVAASTVGNILAASDQAIENSIAPMLPLLAKGMHPG